MYLACEEHGERPSVEGVEEDEEVPGGGVADHVAGGGLEVGEEDVGHG